VVADQQGLMVPQCIIWSSIAHAEEEEEEEESAVI